MKLRHLMHESTQALRGNTLRSLLTIVGIIVGIFSVTAMLSLGEGLSQNVLGRISSFSQGDVSISGTLTREDLAWIADEPFVTAAMGTVSISSADVVVGSDSYSVSVNVELGDAAGVHPFTLAQGEMFDTADADYNEPVAVISDTLESTVAKKSNSSLLNQPILLNGQRFTVIGIMESTNAGFSRNDGTVYVPYRAAVGTLVGTSYLNTVAVKLKQSSDYEVAGKRILEGLNASRSLASDSTDLFRVSTAQSIIETAQETTAMISLFLGIVGGIALFVGGIGTMNMMLTTVTERTKEIGLRKAIGARRRDILLQVLFESIMLTIIGGAVGIGLTALGAIAANNFLPASSPIQVIVSVKVIIIAVAVSVCVGIIFGLYPANRASKLLPVEALRAE